MLAAVAVLRAADAGAAIVVGENGRAVGLLDAEDVLRRVVFEKSTGTARLAGDAGRASLRLRCVPARASCLLPAGGPSCAWRGRSRRKARRAPARRARLRATARTDRNLSRRGNPRAARMRGRSLRRRWCGTVRTRSACSARSPRSTTILCDGSPRASSRAWKRTAGRTTRALRPHHHGLRREAGEFPPSRSGQRLVLEPYPDADHAAIDPYFIAFSERLTRAFDDAGFPLCTGHVMATNPMWRKTLPQWVSQIEGWALRRSPKRSPADIFLDFRPIWGELALGGDVTPLYVRWRRLIRRFCAKSPGSRPARPAAWTVRHDPCHFLRGRHHRPQTTGTLPLVGIVLSRYDTASLRPARSSGSAGDWRTRARSAVRSAPPSPPISPRSPTSGLRQQIADMQAGTFPRRQPPVAHPSERARARETAPHLPHHRDVTENRCARVWGGQSG